MTDTTQKGSRSRQPGIPLAQAGGLPPLRLQAAPATGASQPRGVGATPPSPATGASQLRGGATPTGSLDDAFSWVQGKNPSLAKYLRPQSAFQWWTLPYLASMTPQYIQNLLIGALAGNHVPCYQMFDLMIDTNPEIAACIGEYVDGVSEKKLIIEPYHEEDEQPSDRAVFNQKLVSAALRNMRPDPANDENALRQTIRDILFSRFHGQSVLGEDWFDSKTGKVNRLNVAGIGQIAAPRCTYFVHPVCYAWDVTGRLGLRFPVEDLGQATRDAKKLLPGQLPTDFGLANGLGWISAGNATRPQSVIDFPENQFLISILKSKAGSALGGSCLRPLAWWWCVYNFSGDWLLDLAQLFGIPFRKAKYQQGTPENEKQEAREMLQNMGSRGWCLLDERVDVQFEKAMDQGASSPQGFLIQLAERQFRKVILRQTMTGQDSSTGKGFGAGELDVKGQCLNAGAQLVCEVLREQFGRHVLLVNQGDDSELPFIRMLYEEEGGLEDAQRDQALAAAGLKIGENYLRKKYNIPKPLADEETIGGQAPAAPAAGEGGRLKIEDGKNEPPPNPKSEIQNAKTDKTELEAGDVAGHAFHGNQWTDENFSAATEPLRKKAMLGDEVAFRKDDGTVQRGYLSWKRDGGFEVEHAEVSDHPAKPGFKLLKRTGEKTVLPAEKIRMPARGFKQREFQAAIILIEPFGCLEAAGFDPGQLRAPDGTWGGGGGGGASDAAEKSSQAKSEPAKLKESHEQQNPTRSGGPEGSLESAAHDTGGGAQATAGHDAPQSARTARIATEQQRLRQWAEAHGKLGGKLPVEDVADGHHHEHDVQIHSEDSPGRVLKATRPTAFEGYGYQINTYGPAGHTPSEYLDRQAIHNRFFSDDVRLERVVPVGNKLSIVTSQPLIKGRDATHEEIDRFMADKGFEKLRKGAFYHKDEGVLVHDMFPKNVKVSESGMVHPIDPLIQRATPEHAAYVRDHGTHLGLKSSMPDQPVPGQLEAEENSELEKPAADLATAVVDTLAPLLKYLQAGLEITDEAAQKKYFERALAKWPELTKPLQHDPTLAEALQPSLVKNFIAGLAGKTSPKSHEK